MKRKTKDTLNRPIRPRIHHPPPVFIAELSIAQSQGDTLVKLHPNGVHVKAKHIVAMIDDKREFITTNDGSRVHRQDLLGAVQMLLQNQSTDPKYTNSRPSAAFPSSAFATATATPTTANNDENDLLPYQAHPTESKRPLNAFILYSSTMRKRIRTMFPEYTNSDISKFLGAMWRSAGSDIKAKYKDKAKQYRTLHKEKFPNYQYNKPKPLNTSSQITSQNTGHTRPLGAQETGNFTTDPVFPSFPDSLPWQDTLSNDTSAYCPESEWQEIYDMFITLFPEYSDAADACASNTPWSFDLGAGTEFLPLDPMFEGNDEALQPHNPCLDFPNVPHLAP